MVRESLIKNYVLLVFIFSPQHIFIVMKIEFMFTSVFHIFKRMLELKST